MSLISWVKEKLGGGVPLSGNELRLALEDFDNLVGDTYIRELAFWSAVNLVANAISKCEFKTFLNGKEVKEREYYLWNIEPNKNQNSSGFIHDWIAKLYRNNECLIIEQNGQLLIADEYQRKPYVVYDDIFTEVKIKDFSFNKTFVQSDVLFFELASRDMSRLINGLYANYSKLIAHLMKMFPKTRGMRGTFNYETLPVAGTEQREVFDDLISKKFKDFLNNADAVLPLGKGQEFKDVGAKTYASESSRDIRALIDDVSDFTSKAFAIPPALLRGNVEGIKDALDGFLTFCIDPLADMLSEEINRKRIGYAGFSKGTRVQIDTSTIQHINLLGESGEIYKLMLSGVFSVNDIRRTLGQTVINEEWADKYFFNNAERS